MTTLAYPSATMVAYVHADGEVVAGPTKWVGERTSLGHYKIHHNIGTEDYAAFVQVLCQPESLGGYATVTEQKPDYLCYRVFETGGADHDRDVNLMVLV